MRHCSTLNQNLIKELPAQTFDKNVNLNQLCVDLHCFAAKPVVGAGAHVRSPCEVACGVDRPRATRAPVWPSAFGRAVLC